MVFPSTSSVYITGIFAYENRTEATHLSVKIFNITQYISIESFYLLYNVGKTVTHQCCMIWEWMWELKIALQERGCSHWGGWVKYQMCEVSCVLRYSEVRYRYIFLTRVSNITISFMTVNIKAAKRHWFLSVIEYKIKF